jgi:hypothetical protein
MHGPMVTEAKEFARAFARLPELLAKEAEQAR